MVGMPSFTVSHNYNSFLHTCTCVHTHTHTHLVPIAHVPYILIGAGTASFAAAKAIREKDPQVSAVSHAVLAVTAAV